MFLTLTSSSEADVSRQCAAGAGELSFRECSMLRAYRIVRSSTHGDDLAFVESSHNRRLRFARFRRLAAAPPVEALLLHAPGVSTRGPRDHGEHDRQERAISRPSPGFCRSSAAHRESPSPDSSKAANHAAPISRTRQRTRSSRSEPPPV